MRPFPSPFRRSHALAAFSLLSLPLAAQTVPTPPSDDIEILPVFTVRAAPAPAMPEEPFPNRIVSPPPRFQLADTLTALPNISAQRRGSQAIEPNIRGHAGDRITTTLNGLPVPNGSPTRTVSALSRVGQATTTQIRLHRGLASLTLGPPNLGGHIELSLDPYPDNDYANIRPTEGVVTVHHDADTQGIEAAAAVQASAARHDYRVTLSRNENRDYAAADGREVANDLREWGASLHLGTTLADHQRTTLGVVYRDLLDSENIALPLDNKATSSLLVTLGHTVRPQGSLIEQWTFGAGYGATDPYLDNADRPPPPPFLITSTGRVRTTTARTALNLTATPTTAVTAGVDYTRQTRDAVRQVDDRPLDHIWPDVRSTDLGCFVESHTEINATHMLRIGLRIDTVASDAKSADQLAFGATVRDQFVRFNGPAAHDVSQRDVLPSFNAVLQHDPTGPLSAYTGLNLTSRAPGIGQRYRALLPSLGGGFEIGNPTLDSEKQAGVAVGLRWQTPRLTVSADGFAHRVNDYIHRQLVGQFGPNPVYGWRAVDAEFWGGEASVIWRPAEAWEFPFAVGATQARQVTTDARLAEIPPWEFTGAARWQTKVFNRTARVDLGFRHVAARRNPEPELAPLWADTEEFTLVHLRIDLEVSDQLGLSIGVENLFNQDHYEYLAPPVGGPVPAGRPASGDLRAGDRVPGRGRSLHASATWRF